MNDNTVIARGPSWLKNSWYLKIIKIQTMVLPHEKAPYPGNARGYCADGILCM
jgi:hypothetical protein